jgi:holo-[acyl-carrier protein] synthase
VAVSGPGHAVAFHTVPVSFRVGIDVVAVEQVAAALATHGERYLRRVYTPREVADCGGDAGRLAARFAAKEATRKTLGIADEGVGWSSVEVRLDGGVPAIALSGTAAELAGDAGLTTFSVSLTYEAGLAAAVVLAA